MHDSFSCLVLQTLVYSRDSVSCSSSSSSTLRGNCACLRASESVSWTPRKVSFVMRRSGIVRAVATEEEANIAPAEVVIDENKQIGPAEVLIDENKQRQEQERVGVLLLNLGGPDTLEDVQPFLYNLFADPVRAMMHCC